MMRHLKAGALTLLGLALFNLTTARADYDPSITLTVTNEPTGLYLFNYDLSVPSNSTLPVSEFDLQVNASATLTNLSAPVGFENFYTPGDSSLTFSSSSSDTDIGPGSPVGSFSFLSNQAPNPGTYLIRGFSADGTSFDQTTPGLTVGAPVPEPSTLVLGLLGGVVAAVGCRRRNAILRSRTAQ